MKHFDPDQIRSIILLITAFLTLVGMLFGWISRTFRKTWQLIKAIWKRVREWLDTRTPKKDRFALLEFEPVVKESATLKKPNIKNSE